MILAIDSASVSASAALVSGNGDLIAQSFQRTGLTHSATLLPMIEDLLKNARKAPGEIRSVAVTNGPGSFTGLRIGIATALGFCEALHIPCHGVSSLRTAAYSALPRVGTVAAVMDARREQFYIALFSSDGSVLTRLCQDEARGRDDLPGMLPDIPVCWTGDAASACREQFGGLLPPDPYPAAYGAALCLLQGETRPPEDVRYLRLPQAERERLERMNRGG